MPCRTGCAGLGSARGRSPARREAFEQRARWSAGRSWPGPEGGNNDPHASHFTPSSLFCRRAGGRWRRQRGPLGGGDLPWEARDRSPSSASSIPWMRKRADLQCRSAGGETAQADVGRHRPQRRLLHPTVSGSYSSADTAAEARTRSSLRTPTARQRPVFRRPGSAPTCLGDSAPAWSPDGNRLVFERAFGPIVKDTAAGLDLVTANADGSNEQVILHYRSLEAAGTGATRCAVVAGRHADCR